MPDIAVELESLYSQIVEAVRQQQGYKAGIFAHVISYDHVTWRAVSGRFLIALTRL
jgi:hypothetical protein